MYFSSDSLILFSLTFIIYWLVTGLRVRTLN